MCLAAAMIWSRPDRLLSRLDAGGSELGLRQTIWSQSLEIARQYPIAGVGAGAFPAAMAYYQTGPRDVFYNHAHNQYIELIVDGGALLAVPLLLIGAGLIRRAARQLGTDRGSTFWLRVGAAAALSGLAVMGIWESPFRTPATLMLAAAAAGIATAEARR
jgi:O-antigen ligase